MSGIKKSEKYSIKLFIASSEETEEIRKNIDFEFNALNDAYEATKFRFEAVVWEAKTAIRTKRTQDDYNKLLADCQLVAVIVKNRLGEYTKEEFEKAWEKYEESGSPKAVVYVLPSHSNNDARHEFLKKFEEKGSEYFYCKVDNPDQIIVKIIHELTRIKNEFEAELTSSVESAQETVERLNLNGELTREAVELFEAGDFAKANASLSVEEIREYAKKANKHAENALKYAEKAQIAINEATEAFVLKAKLELTNVTNPDRFKTAEALFEEAIGVICSPDILFEYAYFCTAQNILKKAIKLFEEALGLYRKLDNNYRVAITLNNLALLHYDNGDCEKAKTEYNEALELKRKFGDNTPDVASTLNNLAILHRNNGDYEKAEVKYNEALEIYRKFAVNNPVKYEPYVVSTISNLAVLHAINRCYEKAEVEFKEILTIRRKFAENNPAVHMPNIASTLYNLGALYYDKGDYKQAKTYYTEALELLTPFYKDNPNAYGRLYDMITRGLEELEGLTVT